MDTTDQPAAREPQLFIPALAGFYDLTRGLSWLIIRLTVGGVLLQHGIGKIMGAGVDVFAERLSRTFGSGGVAAAYAVLFLETVGALCIMGGLYTRIFAAAITVEFAVITFGVHFPNGFHWHMSKGGGWEYPFLWGMIFFAIALRGGGPYSLDRRIGKEI